MEFRFLPLLFSLTLMIVMMTIAHAAIPPQVYWERMLPNTPMPKTIINLLNLAGAKKIVYGAKKTGSKDELIPFYGVKKTGSEEELIPFYGAKKIGSEEELIPFYGAKKTGSQEELIPFYGAKKTGSEEELIPFYGAKKTSSEEELIPFYGAKKTGSQEELIPFYGAKKIGSEEELIPFYGTKKTGSEEELIPFYGAKKTGSEEELIPFYGVKKIGSQEELIPFYGAKKTGSEEELIPFYGAKKTGSKEELIPFYGAKKTGSEEELIPFYGAKKTGSQKELIPFYGTKKTGSENELIPFYGSKRSLSQEDEVIPVDNHHHHHHHGNPKVDLAFFVEGLKPGSKIDAHFSKKEYITPLLPREIAQRIPFSSTKIKQIVDMLFVKPELENVKTIKETISRCEGPSVNGEEIHCATSLESMVDFVTSKFGKNAHVISTEAEKESKYQKFVVKDGVKMLEEDKIIACHPLHYPYVVFFCHEVSNSSAYFMPLEGEDGTRVKAAAACHRDTSEWNPNHVVFQMLKIKSGTVPVCHLFGEGNLLWFPK